MRLLTVFFRRPPRRHYALLDEHRRCLMLMTAPQSPRSERWVEINEIRLSWIGQVLPQQALQRHGSATQ